jgi:hypothetical protein
VLGNVSSVEESTLIFLLLFVIFVWFAWRPTTSGPPQPTARYPVLLCALLLSSLSVAISDYCFSVTCVIDAALSHHCV